MCLLSRFGLLKCENREHLRLLWQLGLPQLPQAVWPVKERFSCLARSPNPRQPGTSENSPTVI